MAGVVAEGKGACEAATASWHLLKLSLKLRWAGVPLATAQGPSLRVPSFLLQTTGLDAGAGVTGDPQGSGEAPMVWTRGW